MKLALALAVSVVGCGESLPTIPLVATAPSIVKGQLDVPDQDGLPLRELHATLASLDAEPARTAELSRWRLGLAQADGAHAGVSIEVPHGLAVPVAVGDALTVTVFPASPNLDSQILVLDGHGDAVLAKDSLPFGWTTERGRELDRATHAVIVEPAGAGVGLELVPEWRELDFNGHHYLAAGYIHTESDRPHPTPSEWRGMSTEYALVRVR